MKNDLALLKSEKDSLAAEENDEIGDNIIINYFTDFNTLVIRETYVNSSISGVSYDVNRDNKFDIIEHYASNTMYLESRKIDINGDELFDVLEEDRNRDGIIDSNELQVNMDGMFIPFSTFSTIVM